MKILKNDDLTQLGCHSEGQGNMFGQDMRETLCFFSCGKGEKNIIPSTEVREDFNKKNKKGTWHNNRLTAQLLSLLDFFVCICISRSWVNPTKQFLVLTPR